MPRLGLATAALLRLVRRDASLVRFRVVVLVGCGVVVVFGLLVTGLNSRAVVAPILPVREAMLRVEQVH